MVKSSNGTINPIWLTVLFDGDDQVQTPYLDYATALAAHNAHISNNLPCALVYCVNPDANPKRPKIQVFNRYHPRAV
jgi:hypothetical protein